MARRYRLYVDESGDHSFRGIASGGWDKQYLCLLGCAIDGESYQTQTCPEFEQLKATFFGSDPDDPVVLHREEMVAKQGPFSVLRDAEKNEAFRQAFLDFLCNTNFRIFAVVVDKIGTQGKTYGPLPSHPYHIGMLAMMERYCGWLNFTKNNGDVLAESRGGREDAQLKSAYRTVHNSGTLYRSGKFFQNALTSKEIKLKKKEHNIAGLQLADLIAYPVKRQILYELGLGRLPIKFTKTVADLLDQKQKYNFQVYSGQVWGYGKIFLGQK